MVWLQFEFFIKEAINRVEWRKSIHALEAKSEIKAFLLVPAAAAAVAEQYFSANIHYQKLVHEKNGARP